MRDDNEGAMSTHPAPERLPVKLVDGIVYAPLAKRARIQGTGLEVWEIVREYHAVDRDFGRLRDCFDWLTDDQLQAALCFAELNPEFIAERLAREETAEQRLQELWERLPITKPPHLG
jgi:uncharacterized protein (DUF433 family)